MKFGKFLEFPNWNFFWFIQIANFRNFPNWKFLELFVIPHYLQFCEFSYLPFDMNQFYQFLLPHWGSYVFVKKNRDIIEVNRDSKWSKTANCPTTIIHKRLEISSWNLLHQSSNHNPLIVTIFIQIDAQSEMLWDSQWSDCDNLPLVTTRGNCPTIFQY